MDIIVVASVLFAFFIKGLTGFANTLVLNSILSFRMDNKVISPLDLVLVFPSNAVLAWRERKNVSVKTVITLAPIVLVGSVPGILVLKIGNSQHLKILLGAVIIVLGAEMLLRMLVKNNIKPNAVFLFIIGIMSGFFCGLFGIGAFLAAYISRTAENQSVFRGTICCVFLVENVLRIVLYTVTGILTIGILKDALLMLPFMVIGLIAGIWASGHIKEKYIKIVVVILLVITGVSLILRNI